VSGRPDAPATGRNREPILCVLRDEFRDLRSVLEIGSGSGQHAVYFGNALPAVIWQTSDLIENHAAINAWLAAEGSDNVRAPIVLDVTTAAVVPGRYDAVFSANTAHIMSIAAVADMFRLVGHTLGDRGVFCLYGPFNEYGQFTSESNERFDKSLRNQDPSMGIRDLEEIEALSSANGLRRVRRYMMPANNMLLVFHKTVPL